MPILSESVVGRIDRVAASGRVIPFLALVTIVVTPAAGIFAWTFSPRGFDGLGDALWWAAQTVTTVGYGDVVPATTGGRLIGLFVMVFGVAVVSLITALVTAGFVSYQQRRVGGGGAQQQELLEVLARIERRLDALEQPRG